MDHRAPNLRANCRVQVVLIPVGGIPPSIFQRYVEKLRRFSSIPMRVRVMMPQVAGCTEGLSGDELGIVGSPCVGRGHARSHTGMRACFPRIHTHIHYTYTRTRAHTRCHMLPRCHATTTTINTPSRPSRA